MQRKVETILWNLRWKVLEGLINDEEGDSNLVAVIVLIVIILAVAAIFRTQLLDAVNSVFEKLTEFIG
ncbi:Flp1 family type IVb pilin [Sporofaciens sp. JLR.KK001]|uniref:Flp1 family type IVb pilin n=1 Tax=Sporofaciens sp. JLR.KK001 TaxID=3112621 RepID=UPI002FF09E2D